MLRLAFWSSLVGAVALACPSAEGQDKAAAEGAGPDSNHLGDFVQGQIARSLQIRTDGGVMVWEAVGDGSGLALSPVDASVRAQLKVPEDRGLVATTVRPRGPAWEAGVREQDILLTLDDSALAKPEDLESKLKEAGDRPAALTLLRKGQPLTLSVQPHIRVSLGPIRAKAQEYWIGLSVSDVEPALRAQLEIPPQQGLTITAIAPDSPASKVDLKANDILLSAAGKSPDRVQVLAEIVRENGEKSMMLGIIREGRRREVEIAPVKVERKTFVTSDQLNYAYPALNLTSPATVNVVRSGVIVGDAPSNALASAYQGGFGMVSAAPSPSDADKRLDEMAREIKELRAVIDGLRKALEAQK